MLRFIQSLAGMLPIRASLSLISRSMAARRPAEISPSDTRRASVFRVARESGVLPFLLKFTAASAPNERRVRPFVNDNLKSEGFLMSDRFAAYTDSITAPARAMFAITPSDADPVNPVPKALRFDTAGVVTLRAIDSDAEVTINVQAGEQLAVRALYVLATGTDPIVIHGLA